LPNGDSREEVAKNSLLRVRGLHVGGEGVTSRRSNLMVTKGANFNGVAGERQPCGGKH